MGWRVLNFLKAHSTIFQCLDTVSVSCIQELCNLLRKSPNDLYLKLTIYKMQVKSKFQD